MPEQITFKRQCVFCGKVHNITVDKDKFNRWRRGELIQRVWPEKSADERETMISGSCPACFATLGEN
jgi:hypothetical protein